ncbi:oxidoreductase [Cenarchaeum symbiosum A]|nr:oxidoreductase [Cenarchaeum symbiosum A]
MISGHATAEGTQRIAEMSGAHHDNYKVVDGLHLSNVGMGTYLGDADDATDRAVTDAVKRSIKSGINVIDTAINYRLQRAERSVGRAVTELSEEGLVSRDQIFISTKAGYVTNDSEVSLDFWEYVKKEYVGGGVIQSGDISSGYHCMKPAYLEDQLKRSLANMNVDCIDLVYVHNPVEGQIKDRPVPEILEGIGEAFAMYEKMREAGRIRYYGLATWECFRVAEGDPQSMQLEAVVKKAKDAGGENHGFRFIQLPFNQYFDQAYMVKNQGTGGGKSSILEAAAALDIGVFTSVPFMQGKLLEPGLLPEFGGLSPALRSLQFIRSTPGVLAPLPGHKSSLHTDENLKIMGVPPIPPDKFGELVASLTSWSPGQK